MHMQFEIVCHATVTATVPSTTAGSATTRINLRTGRYDNVVDCHDVIIGMSR